MCDFPINIDFVGFVGFVGPNILHFARTCSLSTVAVLVQMLLITNFFFHCKFLCHVPKKKTKSRFT